MYAIRSYYDNSPSESEAYIYPFIKELEKLFPDIEIKRVDERFTSKMAFKTMIDSGLRKNQRKNKALIDEIVITSYSIHYTKLYEFRFTNQEEFNFFFCRIIL